MLNLLDDINITLFLLLDEGLKHRKTIELYLFVDARYGELLAVVLFSRKKSGGRTMTFLSFLQLVHAGEEFESVENYFVISLSSRLRYFYKIRSVFLLCSCKRFSQPMAIRLAPRFSANHPSTTIQFLGHYTQLLQSCETIVLLYFYILSQSITK